MKGFQCIRYCMTSLCLWNLGVIQFVSAIEFCLNLNNVWPIPALTAVQQSVLASCPVLP